MKILRSVRVLTLVVASLGVGGQADADGAWAGPTAGPPGQPGKAVVFLAQDFRNGGIASVYRAFANAARQLGWTVTAVDGRDDLVRIRQAFDAAIARKADAIILGGVQARGPEDEIARVRQAGIVLVGWHAVATPGPGRGLFANVTTDPREVARIAAEYVTRNAKRPGVVIFSDDRFDIANAKVQSMRDVIQACRRCELLTVENVKLSEVGARMKGAVARLNARFGARWTHSLAINDLYFDEINYPLLEAGRRDIENISAGDGSARAIGRIRAGQSQQVATVAEPVNEQGWQLADELNRAFAGVPPSGYVSRPILVTRPVLSGLGSAQIDSRLPYAEAYQRIWMGKEGKR
ncbi:substrate-binding domain-containing protein [Paludibacterium paludis]|uniref:Sugar ABC transporter substrate-binding protein n=1 Tax=Paludibacterium paludis TaxID=1225769 RepID=A0A918P6L4_9NEIS|nr:substrate-binding domain-containing protein [Paludibacterium paludis]GGY26781.1 sugar ABC transporter substrate-binding protein [Paludibacterium paludis]